MKKILSVVLALSMLLAVMAAVPASAEGTIKIGMITDLGGINDNSFTSLPGRACRSWLRQTPPSK